MPVSFWIRRFLFVFAGVFVVLSGIYLVRGRGLPQALTEGAIWAAVASALFIATRIYHSSKGRRCELCGDLPAGDTGGKIKPE